MAMKTTRQRAPRGTGSVYQRASDQRWVGSLSRVGADMQRERVTVSATTRQEALDKLDAIKAQWKKSPRQKRDSASLTLGMYLDSWVKRNKSNVAPATWRQREQHVRLHIKPSLGTRKLKDITTKHIEKMLDDLVRSGFHSRTASHVRATARVALGDAVREGLIAYNVAMGARTPKVTSVEQQHLSAEQARKLIDSTKGTDFGELWMLAVTSGLRAGELCGLSWGDIDLESAEMHVRVQWSRDYDGTYVLRELKTTQSRRVVPLTSESVDALTSLKKRAEALGRSEPTDAVFTDRAGDRLSPPRLTKLLGVALSTAGLPSVRMHDLRHSTATILLGSGVDVVTVSKVLGHSSPTTTLSIYGHSDLSQKRKAVGRLSEALNGDAD